MPAQGQALSLTRDSDSHRGPQVCLANAFVQLVAHVLAHVPLNSPGNLFDPRYVAWAAPRQPARERALLEHDAALIARVWAAQPSSDVLHWMFALHDDLASFGACANTPLGELDPASVAHPAILQQLRALPIAELLHTTLALLAPASAQLFAGQDALAEHASAAVESAARPLGDALEGFAARTIELVWAFGRSGRALDARILVGAPTQWSGCSAARQAVLAAHEHCVATSPARDYLSAEWYALRTLSRAVVKLDHARTRQAHQRWLAELDLRELLEACVRAGTLARADCQHMLDEPLARAQLLAALSP